MKLWLLKIVILCVIVVLLGSPSYARVSLSFKETGHNFFGGEEVKRTLIISNSNPSEIEVLIRWETFLFGAIIQQGKKELTLKPEETKEVVAILKMPKIKKRADLNWRIQIYEEDRLLKENRKVYSLFPDRDLKTILSKRRIGLFDPGERTRKIFEDSGFEYTNLTTEMALRLFNGDLIIIGSGSLTGRRHLLELLESKVVNGMNLLFFEQDDPFSKESPIDQSEILSPGHPILYGIKERDLSHWRGDGSIAKIPLKRPEKGPFRVILCYHGNPLVAEIPFKRGRVILSQLLIIDKFWKEPMAKIIFGNLIAYGLTGPEEFKRVAIFGQADNKIARLLDSVGVVGPRNPPGLSGFDLAILVVDEEFKGFLGSSFSYDVANFLNGGGSVFVFNLTPQAVYCLREIFPKEVLLIRSSSQNKITIDPKSSLFWGIDKDELRDMIRANPIDYVLEFEEDRGARTLIRPGFMAKFHSGAGQLIISQIRFQLGDDVSERILSQLMTNLGVEMKNEKGVIR